MMLPIMIGMLSRLISFFFFLYICIYMNLDSPIYSIPFLLSLVKLKDDISYL